MPYAAIFAATLIFYRRKPGYIEIPEGTIEPIRTAPFFQGAGVGRFMQFTVATDPKATN